MPPSERETPEAVFATAQSAIARGDWEAFFACLDRPELLRIAKNGVGLMIAGPPEPGTQSLCATHGFPIDDVRARGQRIVESAGAIVANPTRPPDAATMREQSSRHKALVDDYTDAIESSLGAVPDLAAFTAALERHMRAGGGGGSVSSRLFVGETLTDLVVEGKKARGKRRLDGGAVEDIAFARKTDGWHIRLPLRRT